MLRSHLRAEPEGLNACGPLGSHLALLLPEIGAARELTLVAAEVYQRLGTGHETPGEYTPTFVQ